MFLPVTVLLCWQFSGAWSFTVPNPNLSSQLSISMDKRGVFYQLYASSPSDGNENENVDDLRSILEASWDADTMGEVPGDANVAANEAFSSILSASEAGVSIFFIDLLLPSLDVTQGSNLYDEVQSVVYCIALAECFREKSCILVRDNKTVQTVNRILNRRDKERQAREQKPSENDIENNEAIDSVIRDTSDAEGPNDNFGVSTNRTKEGVDGEAGSDANSDVESFRRQLLSTWDDESIETSNDTTPPPANVDAVSATQSQESKRYRLASLFGDEKISDGADMMTQVVEALRANALPEDDEEYIIVLSAINMDEMVAVRSLAAKYAGQKKIILVNCKLNPIPRELYGAETVYSILPLVARMSGTDQQASTREGQVIPKVVVLRRYPGDWQAFIDIGYGFKLAQTAPRDLSNQRGPPQQWIQAAIQDFMRLQS